MVKAGVYLIAGWRRASPIPGWHPTVITLGLATMLLAGWRGARIRPN